MTTEREMLEYAAKDAAKGQPLTEMTHLNEITTLQEQIRNEAFLPVPLLGMPILRNWWRRVVISSTKWASGIRQNLMHLEKHLPK